VVRVGYANEAPYAYFEQSTGRVTGEAPEIIRQVMKRLGVDQVEGVLTEWGSLIPGLKAGRFDIIAAGMYITPKRCREVGFTNPTYGIGEGFIVRAGNPRDLHSYTDLANDAEARLGVVAGTVELGYATKLGVPRDRILILPDNPAAVAAVQAGRADAFAGTALTVKDLLAKAGDQSGLEQARPFEQPLIEGKTVVGYGAFAVRKGDDGLREAINAQLADFLGTPEHLRLVRPFGFGKDTLPGKVTAAELCAE
jgi:polar amino acid transport system substrate-binding protein